MTKGYWSCLMEKARRTFWPTIYKKNHTELKNTITKNKKQHTRGNQQVKGSRGTNKQTRRQGSGKHPIRKAKIKKKLKRGEFKGLLEQH